MAEESELPDSALVDKMPASSGSGQRTDALPPKPKYRAKPGLVNSNGKDYTVIKRVEVMNRTRSHSKGKRSSSRTRQSGERGREANRAMDTKSSELGGFMRSSSRQRPESRGPKGFLSRGRSSSRQDHESKESKVGRSRSRIGKGFLKKMRSLSRRRKHSPETTSRGRSSSRVRERRVDDSERSGARWQRDDDGINVDVTGNPPRPEPRRTRKNEEEESPRNNVEEGDVAPAAEEQISSPHSNTNEEEEGLDTDVQRESTRKNDENLNKDEDEDEDEDEDVEEDNVEDNIEEHRAEDRNRHGVVENHGGNLLDGETSEEEEEENERYDPDDPDALTEADVMNIDSKNTKMHVACMLHYPSKDIVCQLQLDNSLAFKPNSANELPLHYAMMDKKGVNDEVLLTLLNLNPDAVQYPNSHRSLPIHLACLTGAVNKDAIRALVSMCPDSVMVRSKVPLPFEPDMLDNLDNDSEGEDEPVDPNKQPETTASSGSFLDYIGYNSQNPPPPPPPASGSEKRKSKKKRCVDDELTQGKQMYETGWTPLHLAIINGAESSVIELLVSANPQCVFVKTNRGRKPIDCAQYMVRQHWLYGTDDETTVQKTFAAIELLEETAIDYR